MANNPRPPYSLALWSLSFFLKPSAASSTFLRFSSTLILAMLFLEVIIDFTLEFESTSNHIFLKIALYVTIFVPNVTFLIIFKNHVSGFFFLPTFLLVALCLRFFLCKIVISANSDIDLLSFSIFSLPLYGIFILLTPKPKFRLLLVLLHQISMVSLLNLKWTLGLALNLKLLMCVFSNLAIFLKSSGFLVQNPKIPGKRKTNFELNLPIQNDWKGVIDEIPEGIMLISADKSILYSNSCAFDLLDLDLSKNNSAIYQNIVLKFGKLEEIQNLVGNLEEKHGFIKFESSSLTGRKSPYLKKGLGVNPVNIFSSKVSSSRYFANHFFGNTWTKEWIPQEKNNEIADASNFHLGLGEKLNEKLSENFLDIMNSFQETPLKLRTQEPNNSSSYEFNKNQPIAEMPNLEKTLDNIIDFLISKPSKSLKMYHSEISEANKKKLELKIKKVSFKNSTAFLLTFQDVSFLKFFQQVCENNEYKNKVLTTLSHELRTPLNGALIPLERIRNENLDIPSEMQDGLDVAYKSMVLLQNVLNDVVDFALINSNQLYLNYDELDLFKFLENIVDLFRRQAQEKGLYLHLNYENCHKVPHIMKTDFQRLSQILVSLLNNSLKNTFEGGISLEVTVVERPDEKNVITHCLKIIVEDTGVGIDEAKLKNIKNCLKTKDMVQICENLNKNQGCGLGLTISHCLALLLGPPNSNGLHVRCRSQKGTEFRFYLKANFEKSSENLTIIEEKTRDIIKTSPTYKTPTHHMYKFDNSPFRESQHNRKSTQRIRKFDFDYTERSHDKRSCESERNNMEFKNFLYSHTLQTKNMLEITCDLCEVLIVDDDSFNLMALEAILSKFKLKCIRAFNGQQALDKIFERHRNFPKIQAFSMVFLDYHMPVKNGLETTKEIVNMFREDGLMEFPIIACTAFGARDLAKQWSCVGVSEFVVKPISYQKIEGLLRNFKVLK